MSTEEQDRLAAELCAEIGAELAAEEATRAKKIRDSNLRHAGMLAELPVQVQVRRHETDIYDVCDIGRIGWVRRAPEEMSNGSWSVYVEDMGPGRPGDRNPTRYHQPMHLFPV